MISGNSAMYLGIFCAVVFEECPEAYVSRITRDNVAARYSVEFQKKGAEKTWVSGHEWPDRECDFMPEFVDAARRAGERIGRELAAAK